MGGGMEKKREGNGVGGVGVGVLRKIDPGFLFVVAAQLHNSRQTGSYSRNSYCILC